jgi:DNA-3-methyladenine glycosylase I
MLVVPFPLCNQRAGILLGSTYMAKLHRCAWAETDPLLRVYHDEEWAVPEYDSRMLWETLMLEGFQAGLSWLTILRKREAFRNAFRKFDPEEVARFTEDDVSRLLADPAIIRSRAKIEATINGARIFLATHERGDDFSQLVWSMAGGYPILNTSGHVPAKTMLSEHISTKLREMGFKFVGPVIVYAWMQAVGMVNDHVENCFRRNQVNGQSKPRRSQG